MSFDSYPSASILPLKFQSQKNINLMETSVDISQPNKQVKSEDQRRCCEKEDLSLSQQTKLQIFHLSKKRYPKRIPLSIP